MKEFRKEYFKKVANINGLKYDEETDEDDQ